MVTRYQLLTMSLALTPLARKIVAHMDKLGSISAREALLDLGVTSASLARRITEIAAAGIPVKREQRRHKATGQLYTRYSVEGLERSTEETIAATNENPTQA